MNLSELTAEERCPLFDRVAELEGPRSLAELALVVAEWTLLWREGTDAERIPLELFRDDETPRGRSPRGAR